MSPWFRPRAGGVDVFVRLTPRAASDAIDGMGTASDGTSHLTARVRVVPDKGAANRALEQLVAKSFGLPKKSVAVVSGATARLKTVRLSGEPAALVAILEQAAALGFAGKRG